MCLGRSRICLGWYQGTGIGYHECLVVHEAYKLRRILAMKESSRGGMVVSSCDPSTVEEVEACGVSFHRTRKRSPPLLSALPFLFFFFFCLFTLRMCVFISGAAVIAFVLVYLVWPLFSVTGEMCLPSKQQFFWHIPSLSFHVLPWAERSCNVFIYSLSFLILNISFPSSLSWAKVCFRALDWIASFSWMLYFPFSTFLTS